jgi:hypothetical protein
MVQGIIYKQYLGVALTCLILALFDQLCGALECPLLGEEQAFVSADRSSTVGLFIASAD